MKKNIYLSIVVFILFFSNKFFVEAETKTFTKKTGYLLYEHNVENFCKEYKNTDNSSELIYALNESSYFKKIEKNDGSALKTAQKEYQTNMDAIYACAINVSFKRQIELIKEKLINTNAKLNAKMRKKLDSKIQAIHKKIQKLRGNCKLNNAEASSIIKKSVLKQTSYELCKYNFYLEYLKAYYNNNIEAVMQGKVKNKTSIMALADKNSDFQFQIQAEIEKSYRAFPIVFQSYSDFENNIAIHLLLELLREDYNIFREEFHKTLNPINQVVYKISNAMRK